MFFIPLMDHITCTHRFLTISERLQATTPGGTTPALSYVNLGANGSSSNVFTLASEEPPTDERPSLLGTGSLLNVRNAYGYVYATCMPFAVFDL